MTWSPVQTELIRRDMTIGTSMVTLKVLPPFVGTILGNYFVSFDPLILKNCSGLSTI